MVQKVFLSFLTLSFFVTFKSLNVICCDLSQHLIMFAVQLGNPSHPEILNLIVSYFPDQVIWFISKC